QNYITFDATQLARKGEGGSVGLRAFAPRTYLGTAGEMAGSNSTASQAVALAVGRSQCSPGRPIFQPVVGAPTARTAGPAREMMAASASACGIARGATTSEPSAAYTATKYSP